MGAGVCLGDARLSEDEVGRSLGNGVLLSLEWSSWPSFLMGRCLDVPTEQPRYDSNISTNKYKNTYSNISQRCIILSKPIQKRMSFQRSCPQ